MRELILNLTQHNATLEQKSQGVVDLPPEVHNRLRALLTFKVEGMGGLLNHEKPVLVVKDRARTIVKSVVIPYILNEFALTLDGLGLSVSGLDWSALIRMGKENGISFGAMIGGAPYLMPILQTDLILQGVDVLYSLSERVSEEAFMPDGTIEKRVSFQHKGFLRVTA
jgi:hypothetical protein